MRRIKGTADRLREFPLLGRPGVYAGTREIPVRGLPYLLVYSVSEKGPTVIVLNIFHGARNRPTAGGS